MIQNTKQSQLRNGLKTIAFPVSRLEYNRKEIGGGYKGKGTTYKYYIKYCALNIVLMTIHFFVLLLLSFQSKGMQTFAHNCIVNSIVQSFSPQRFLTVPSKRSLPLASRSQRSMPRMHQRLQSWPQSSFLRCLGSRYAVRAAQKNTSCHNGSCQSATNATKPLMPQKGS